MYCVSELHFQAAKSIVRYIKATVNYGIKFPHLQNFMLHGYSDSDWAGSVDDMKTGYYIVSAFDQECSLGIQESKMLLLKAQLRLNM
jgi:hypothetical protein